MIDTEVVGDLGGIGKAVESLELDLVSFIGGRYTRRSALRRLDRRLSDSRIQTFALLTRAIGTCATAGRRIIVRPAATLLKKGIP